MVLASVVSKFIVISDNCIHNCICTVVWSKVGDIPHYEYSVNFQLYWNLLLLYSILSFTELRFW